MLYHTYLILTCEHTIPLYEYNTNIPQLYKKNTQTIQQFTKHNPLWIIKIDEPDTPYTHYDHNSDGEGSESSALHPRSPDENQTEPALATQWNDISSKLQAVADKRDACPLSPAPSRESNMSDSEMSELERKKKEEHEKKFKDARKKHYNEAEMMRRWREQHANDDDDEDEDEEEDNANSMEE